MAITTLTNVKILMGVSDASLDAAINLLIPMVEDAIKSYCNNDFVVTTTATDGTITNTTVIPKALESVAVGKITRFLSNRKGVASESDGIASATYVIDWTPEEKSIMNKHRILKLQ